MSKVVIRVASLRLAQSKGTGDSFPRRPRFWCREFLVGGFPACDAGGHVFDVGVAKFFRGGDARVLAALRAKVRGNILGCYYLGLHPRL